jgi:hypothetical protein
LPGKKVIIELCCNNENINNIKAIIEIILSYLINKFILKSNIVEIKNNVIKNIFTAIYGQKPSKPDKLIVKKHDVNIAIKKIAKAMLPFFIYLPHLIFFDVANKEIIKINHVNNCTMYDICLPTYDSKIPLEKATNNEKIKTEFIKYFLTFVLVIYIPRILLY